MRCRATVAIPRMTINGKLYREGEFFAEVVISEMEFKALNKNPNITGLKYEEIKEEVKTSKNRAKLEEKANELEIEYRANIGDAKLLDKILEVEPEFKL